MTGPVLSELERLFRAEHGRAVAVLTGLFGDLDVAEEAVQEAFAAAARHWPSAGVPPSPAGWIITVARNRAIDRLRREALREDRHAQAALLHACDHQRETPGDGDWDGVPDDRLRLIFTCCHPALATGAQVAPTPVVALNRAVAVAEVEGPQAALTLVEGLGLDGYHLWHAVRAGLLERLGRGREAAAAYEAAITRCGNAAEVRFLRRGRRLLGAG
ncbi:sigma factor [Streptosporangium pseudovulgare]|uniref:RNA polymerase sigma-70 region 2 domain-containing protein n=1 Tax=Streptosporangium pseudovulgare TaxID=35765 RepID=A0ABQ2R521_9ACTN|nr:sigma factor [Streptosporangium pseudovulgare]GGQ14151.1 hypothetical protein GCM10010140_50510 [Streptosporangium pseudovulgare]